MLGRWLGVSGSELVLAVFLVGLLLVTSSGPPRVAPSDAGHARVADDDSGSAGGVATPSAESSPSGVGAVQPPADGSAAARTAEAKPVGPRGEMTVAQDGAPTTLDPWHASSAAELSITLNIYDTLFTRAADGKLEPGLATQYRPLDDRSWEIKLRQNVTFHNGEVFDAEAVKFTLDRVRDPATRAANRSLFEPIEDVVVVDPRTIKITTRDPDPLLPSRLAMHLGQILPPKYTREVGPEGLAKRPIGAGPYRLESWNPDGSVRIEAIPDHWRRPRVARVTFRPMPDAAARAGAIKRGQIDIAVGIPSAEFEAINKARATRAVELATDQAFVLGLDTIELPAFRDPRVRQALNLAVDVEGMLKGALHGTGRPLTSPVIPQAWGHDFDLKGYPYDPERARQLLAEAGFAGGFEVKLDTTDGRSPRDREMATLVAAQLARVGLTVKIAAFEWDSFLVGVRERKRAPMMTVAIETPLFDAYDALAAYFHSDQSQGWSRWKNEELDRLLDQARTSQKDVERRQMLQRAQQIVIDEAPCLFLHQVTALYGVSRRVRDWEPTVTEAVIVWNASVL